MTADKNRVHTAVDARQHRRRGSVVEWPKVRLADVARIVMGQSPPGETYNDHGDGLPFFQGKADFGEQFAKPRKWCSAPSRIAQAGDILLSVRAPVGPTNIAREESCIGRGLAAIRAMPERAHQGYLRFFLRYQEPVLSRQGQGSTFSAIRRAEVEGMTLPLPPLSEQRRIVEILDQADRLRRLRAEADAKADRILPALFLKMFGDPATNPMGWPVKRLGELSEHVTSGSRGWARYTGAGPARFLRTQDIVAGDISPNLLALDPPKGAEAERTRLQNGDVAVTITGIVGKAATFRGSEQDVYVSQHVALIRPDPRQLTSDYLTSYANLPLGKVPVLARFQYGQTKPGLGFRELTNSLIPVPPIDMQTEFSKRLACLRPIQNVRIVVEARLDRLWSVLSMRAFSSDLTSAWREAHMKELLQEMEQQAKALRGAPV